MVMDRNSKLAAARKKLAKFQESKTVTVVNKKPNAENISRDVIDAGFLTTTKHFDKKNDF